MSGEAANVYGWRVVWGFGAFKEFPTEKEADEFYRTLDERQLPMPPFAIRSQREKSR